MLAELLPVDDDDWWVSIGEGILVSSTNPVKCVELASALCFVLPCFTCT